MSGRVEPLIDKNDFESLLKRVSIAAKVAKGLALLLLVISLFIALLGVVSWAFLQFMGDWGVWSWILPLALVGIPTVYCGVLWYAFSIVVEAPKLLLEMKDSMTKKLPLISNKFKSKSKGGEGKKISASLKLCWELFETAGRVDDVMFAGTVIGFFISPIGWITSLIVSVWGAIGLLCLAGCCYYSVTF